MSKDSQTETLIIKAPKLTRVSLLVFHLLIAVVAMLLSMNFLGDTARTNAAPQAPLIDYTIVLCLIACGIYALVYAIRNYVRGRQLTLTPEGLSYRYGDVTGFLRWADIERFRLEAPLLGTAQRLGWVYPPEQADKPHIWKRLYSRNEARTSMHGDLGHSWQGGVASVCDTLESWRVRYGSSETQAPLAASLDLPEAAIIRFVPRLYALPIFLSSLLIFFFSSGYAFFAASPYREPNGLQTTDFLFLAIIGFMVFCLWVVVRRVIAKPSLLLNPLGLSIRDEKGLRFIAWNDIAGFKVVTGYNAYVPAQIRWEREPHLAPARGSQFIGHGYALNAYALHAMLEDWRIRFKPDT